MAMRFTPYLMLDGNAREAIEFYEKALDAKVLSIITYGEMGAPCPDALKDHVAHAMLRVDDADLMFSDSPGIPVQSGDQVQICISTQDVEKTKQIYEALQQDGQVNAPLEETPFSPAFANVTDKFGITFQIVTENQN